MRDLNRGRFRDSAIAVTAGLILFTGLGLHIRNTLTMPMSLETITASQAITIASNLVSKRHGWNQRASYHPAFGSEKWAVFVLGGPASTNSNGEKSWAFGDHLLIEMTANGVVTNIVYGH